MSWESEFASQWQTFLNTVETRIRREINKRGKLDSALANSIIQSEVAKWSISTHYNGAWLRNLTLEYPSWGKEFQAVLEELRLGTDLSLKLGFPFLQILVISGLMLVTFLLMGWQGQSLLKQFIGTLVIALITIPIGAKLWNNQKKKVVDILVDQIQESLDVCGQRLRDIALRVDQAQKG